MNSIKYFLLIIFQFAIISSQNSKKNSHDFLGILLKIFEGLETNCFPELEKVLNERKKLEKNKAYPWLGDSLGKNFNNMGDETECINTLRNTTFIMMNLYNITSIRSTKSDLYDFLEITNSSLGICIMDLCEETFYRYAKIVVKFLNVYARQNDTKDQVTFIVNSKKNFNYTHNVKNSDKLETSQMKMIIIYIFMVFFVLKMIAGILRIIFIPKGYGKYLLEKMSKSKINIAINDVDEKSSFSKKRKIKASITNEENQKEYNPLFDFTDKLPIYIKIFKAFDIWDDLYYLSSKRNKYFNDIGLDVINFNRTIVIFFLVFSRTYSTFITLPTSEIINETFFKNWLNIFYRLSNNAFTCWIFLEGAHTTYKLLCFITTEMFIYYAKDHKNKQNFNLRLLVIYGKFLLLLLPKFIEFFCVYYMFYYNAEDFSSLSSNKATFYHIMTYLFKKDIKCKSFSTLFNFNFTFNFQDYNTCYEFIFVYFNMFLSIILSMIFIYFFFLIKKPVFEIIIMLLNIGYFLASVTFIDDPRNQENGKLLEYHIIGQTYTNKVFHSFIGCFHLGLIVGFLLFNLDGTKNRLNKLIYENYLNYFSGNNNNNNMSKNVKDNVLLEESLSDNTYSDTDILTRLQSFSSTISSSNYQIPYYPLLYMNKIVKWFKKKSFSTKVILILLCLLFFILLSLSFILILAQANNFDITITRPIKYLFMYEKPIFILAFFFLNVVMITLPKKGVLRDMMNSRIVIFVSRIGFLLSCCVYAFTYFSFLVSNLKVKLFVPTIMVMSFGNFLFICIECFFIYSFIELPLAILIKKIVRIGRGKENLLYN